MRLFSLAVLLSLLRLPGSQLQFGPGFHTAIV